MGTTLVRMPGGAIAPVDDTEVPSLLEAGATLIEAPAAVDKFGAATTAADPRANALVDTFSESIAGVREGRLASYEDEGLQAFGEGLATSLTAGLYGGDDEDLALRAEVNPVASLAGQATGLIGGALAGPLAGASGLAARAGTLAAGVAEARGVGAVGRLAIEGAVDGLTYATMREGIGATVYDKPFSAEAIAMEALTGAGVGATLGLAAKGAKSIQRALTKEDIASDVLRKSMATPVADEIPVGAFDSTLPPPPTAIDALDPTIEPTREVIGATPSNPKTFYRDMPHMQVVDEHFGKLWNDVDSITSDMAFIPADHPQWSTVEPLWKQMQADRREVAKGLGMKAVKDEVVSTQRDLVKYDVPEDAWRRMDPRNTAKNQKTIDALNNLVGSARKLDEALMGIRDTGGTWFNTDQALDLAGGSSRITGKVGNKTRAQEVSDRLKAYDEYIAKRQAQMPNRVVRSDTDYVVREVLRKSNGKATGKMEGGGFARSPAGPEAAEIRVRGSKTGPRAPLPWNTADARPASVIQEAIANGEPPHLEEILMLSRDEQKAVMSKLKQKHWDSLEFEVMNNPKMLEFYPDSKPIGIDSLSDYSRTGSRLNEEAFFSGMPAPAKRPTLHSDADIPAQGPDSMPVTGNTGSPLGNILSRTNLMGLAMAGMFPKLAIAKIVIEKYGAKIARAAEVTLNNRVVQMTARKIPQLAWATALAPGGSDHDRNLRAVYEASKNPQAFAAAVDESLGNISSDNPEEQIKARERITTQLEWMIRNMPPSLSQLKLVVPSSSVSAFNAMVESWIEPMAVLASGKTAPTTQLNAVKELWPETYQDWLSQLVTGTATMAAEGKEIPRNVGRLLPMASPSWTPAGISILQKVTMEKAQNGGGKPDVEALAPSTSIESMSKNRIELNK